ncbi:NADH:ubiquinone reductase (Na(+)-transporting) subunit B [Simkania negevensis]|uniref:Na(+)-translocating NADH-quinone reductase subunit B n=1 Tax=Simkania negevensis TaxID=83561 RepID=A0ABS3AQN7_9BACT|nr:NADH:ubiquinone reductase (Na(+)-transporting) subunit B [Simkania negevensis]
MLRKLLDAQLSLVSKGKPLHKLRPLVSAGDTFFYEAACSTRTAPHVRDTVDLKRWMILVVVALLPCIIWSIWNTGLQNIVYTSGNLSFMREYLKASTSFSSYFTFAFSDMRWLTIIAEGLKAFLPVVLISYIVGGIWEGIFACIRKHEINEGFLVTGILYPLILPSTTPYWIVAIGVSFGVVIGKELFGGTGMNILNPALTCRAFLYFSFPSTQTGNVWAGTNNTIASVSVNKMNQQAEALGLDGVTQATPLGTLNITPEIKRVHIDAIATNTLQNKVGTYDTIQRHFDQWDHLQSSNAQLGALTPDQMKSFVTAPITDGGLGLGAENYQAASDFSSLNYGIGHDGDWTFFFGNQLGSMGETSFVACLLGAIFLILVGIGSWRNMVAMGLGALITAYLFELGAKTLGIDQGAWNPAKFAFPAYKHLLLGGLAFGLVFMITDPVSSPGMKGARWIYGLFIGALVIVIRTINPAFPEGVMLAILFGNVFAPLLDFYAVRNYRRLRRVKAR